MSAPRQSPRSSRRRASFASPAPGFARATSTMWRSPARARTRQGREGQSKALTIPHSEAPALAGLEECSSCRGGCAPPGASFETPRFARPSGRGTGGRTCLSAKALASRSGHRLPSRVVLELGLGVERLRRRSGDCGGRGRRRGAGGETRKNSAGGKDARNFGHLRVLSISACALALGRIAEGRDSIKSARPIDAVGPYPQAWPST
jgi:hypothetical protein